MNAQRFRLEILPAGRRRYTVRTSCPGGEGRAELKLPFPPAEAEALARTSPRLAGEKLFQALFQGENLRLFDRTVDRLADDAKAVLRLEFVLDPRDAKLAALQALPWELLNQPGSPAFVALDLRRSLVRYLAVPRPVLAGQRPKVLRILAVAPDPRLPGARPLDLEGELRNLREAVASSADLELIELPTQTLAALRHALVAQECHVLHFLGHGGLQEESGKQVLFFEGERRSPDPVTGPDLMNKLAGVSGLRLVVLNACESGRAPEGTKDAPWNPLAGVANSLVQGGFPAVIAMRQPLSDRAAIAFSRGFYRRLSAGDLVEAAVVEGRQEIHSADPDGFEWATPMLFLRTSTGEIYPARDLAPEPASRKHRARRIFAALGVLLLLLTLTEAGRRWWTERLVQEGSVLSSDKRWAEAHDLFVEARRISPRSAVVAGNLAFSQENLGDPQSAEALYREAVRLAPESAVALYNLGHFLNDRENPAEAYAVLLQAAQRNPQNPEIYAELARAELHRNLFARARVLIGLALRLDPERAVFHRRLGEIELAAGKPAAAIPPLKEARRRFPPGDLGLVETIGLLAEAEDRLGNETAACRFVEEFRLLDTAGTTLKAPAVEGVAARRRCASVANGGPKP